MLLARNSSVDRGKAIGYIEQAITVMETYAEARGDDDKDVRWLCMLLTTKIITNSVSSIRWTKDNGYSQRRTTRALNACSPSLLSSISQIAKCYDSVRK